MAWTDQCKIAFCSDASNLIGVERKKHGAITRVLKRMDKETDIPFNTLKRWYYEKYDKNGMSNRIKNDPTKSKSLDIVEPTKIYHSGRGGKREGAGRKKPPETQEEFWLEAIKKIETGKVSDDLIKMIGQSIAKAIDDGTCATRVGADIESSIKRKRQKNRIPLVKEVDNFLRLKKHVLAAVEGLIFWADGTIKPETENEAIEAKIIIGAVASIVIQLARLGIDVVSVYETFMKVKSQPDLFNNCLMISQ